MISCLNYYLGLKKATAQRFSTTAVFPADAQIPTLWEPREPATTIDRMSECASDVRPISVLPKSERICSMQTSVSALLGDTVEPSEDKNIIAQKLEQLNALLAEKNRRSRRIWKVVVIILISIAAITVLLIILNISTYQSNESYYTNPVITEQKE
jgi:hypothetical protein